MCPVGLPTACMRPVPDVSPDPCMQKVVVGTGADVVCGPE